MKSKELSQIRVLSQIKVSMLIKKIDQFYPSRRRGSLGFTDRGIFN